jgi:hypothetical protein
MIVSGRVPFELVYRGLEPARLELSAMGSDR